MKSIGVVGLLLTLCPFFIAGSAPIRVPLFKTGTRWKTYLLGDSNDVLVSNQTTVFFGTMTLGTPAQSFTFAFDTTTDTLWVPGEACSNCGTEFNSTASSTFQDLSGGQLISSLFNTFGFVTYFASSDTLNVTGLSDANQAFGVATAVSNPVAGIDGLAGLGPGSNSFVRNVLAQNNLSSVYSLYIEPNQDGAEAGEIILGSSTSDEYSADQLVTVMSGSQSQWTIPIQNITAGNSTIECMSCFAEISILGSPNITGPEGVIQSLYYAIQANSSGYVNQTDDLPSLTFTINGSNFTLTSDDYIDSCANNVCSTKFASSSNNNFVFGTVFVSKYFWIFNLTSYEIGIAPFNGGAHLQAGLFILSTLAWAWFYLEKNHII